MTQHCRTPFLTGNHFDSVPCRNPACSSAISVSHGWQTIPEKGTDRSHEPFKSQRQQDHISGTAEARVVKFCMHVGCVKSQHKDDTSPLKGAWSGSRDPLQILMAPVIPLKRLKIESSNFARK